MQHSYTFEALYLKYIYLFSERCRKSNKVWLHALIQSHCQIVYIRPYSLNTTTAFYLRLSASTLVFV